MKKILENICMERGLSDDERDLDMVEEKEKLAKDIAKLTNLLNQFTDQELTEFWGLLNSVDRSRIQHNPKQIDAPPVTTAQNN